MDAGNFVYTGAIGHIGAYSFFPSKTLGGFGDGGLLVTQDDALADQADMLRKHGARRKYHNEILGFNSRLDALQAAMLRVKLRYIDPFNEGRRRVAAAYQQALADVPGVIAPEPVPGHVFHQYTIRVLNGKRDQLKARLAEEGISTMIYYPIPQDRLPVYAHMNQPPNPVSDQMTTEVLSLPIWPTCGEDTVGYIADTLRSILQQL
jgi:dTDP-4-amino-4,6-dideoxygalactose transaminase